MVLKFNYTVPLKHCSSITTMHPPAEKVSMNEYRKIVSFPLIQKHIMRKIFIEVN